MIKQFFNRYIVFPANYHIKLTIIIPVLILVGISLTILFASNPDSFKLSSFFGKQSFFLFFSIISFLIIQSIKPHFFYENAYLFYGLLVLAIIANDLSASF